MGIKFSNLASTTLASGVSSSTTSISVTSATSFPTLGSGDYFYASIGIGSASEVVKVTAISGTTFTAVRGQDSTTAISHSSGAEIALRVVAATLEDLRDAIDTDTTYSAGTGVSLSGTTFSLTDTNSKLNLSGGTLTGNLTLQYAYPRINLTDTNHDSDYSIINNDGAFSIYDVTNNSHRLSIASSGNATFSGSVTSTTGFTTGANTRVQSSSGMLFVTGVAATVFEVGAGSEKMRLTSTGLGLGTTSVNAKLHVSDTTAPTFRLSRTGTGQIWQQSIDSSGRFLLQEAASEGGTKYTRLQIDDTGEATFSGSVTADGLSTSSGTALVGEGASGGSTQLIYWNGTNAYYGRSNLGGSVSTHQFRSGGATKLTVNSTGIDVTGTATMDALDVNGAAKLNSSSAEGVQLGGDAAGSTHIGNLNNNAGRLSLTGASTRSVAIRTGSTTADTLVADHSNNVNIPNGSLMVGSTTAPSATLEVGALTSGSTGNVIINHEGGVTPVLQVKARTNRAILAVQDNDTSGYISSENGIFSIGRNSGSNANNINIDANNNVGIGVSSPATPLHVSGTARADIVSVQSELFLGSSSMGKLTQSGSNWVFNTWASGAFGERFRIKDTGVDVSGSVTSTTGFTTGANTRVQSSSGMLFVTGVAATVFEVGAGSEKMRLTSTGLGIGVSSPTEKLEVVGAAQVSGARLNIQRSNDDSSIAFANNSSGTPSGNTWAIGRDYSNSEALSFAFATNGYPSLTGSEKMHLSTGGNLSVSGSVTANSFTVDTGTVSASPSARFRRNHGGQAYQQLSGLSFYWNTSNGHHDNTIVYGASANSSLKFTQATGSAFNDTLTINSSGNATFSGEIYAKDANSSTDPTYAFTGHTDTGMGIYYSGSQDNLSLITDGVRRAFFNSAGITSSANVYTGNTSSFRNYGGTWKATTGLTGNGFSFINSVDGTAATISSTGNATFSGTVTADKLKLVNDATDGIKISRTSGASENLYLGTKASAGISGTTYPAQIEANGCNILEIYTHGNQPVVFGTNSTEKMRLSGSTLDVGRGNVADATVLIDSASGGDPTLVFDTGATNRSAVIRFKDQGTISGFINYHHQYDRMDFGTGSSTGIGMSLTGGNLLVGKTSSGIGVTGTSVLSNGQLLVTADADNPVDFNRKTSNGVIANFRKDGTAVGSIASEGGDSLVIQSGTTSGSGLLFHPTVASITPVRNSVKIDATIDLGRSGFRFKDLYLSGSISSGAITATADTDALTIFTTNNGAGADIRFSDQTSRAQSGYLRYVHSDTASYGSGNAFLFNSTESTTTVLADGKLMFKEGLYLKPSSGTGAGTEIIDSDRNITTPTVYLNDTNTRLHEGSGNALRITTGTGYIDIGSMNSGWIHFQGNKPYYFNQPLSMDADLKPYSTAGARNLGTTSTVWNHVYAKGYFIDSTEVIDANRNLTNIGTITSTAFRATNNGTNRFNVNVGGTEETWAANSRASLHLDGSSSALIGFRHGGSNRGYIFSTGSTIEILSYGEIHLLSSASSSYFGKLSAGVWNTSHGYKVNGTTVIDSSRNLTNISNAYITNGGALHNYTSSGSLRGYIQAVESGGGTAAGLVIATSGGETISFKDGGLSGTLNAEITGGGDLNLITGTLDINGTTVIDSSRNITAATVGVTNIVTNKVVKFNGSILDDSNITDTGSVITLGSNTTVSGTISTGSGTNGALALTDLYSPSTGDHLANIGWLRSSGGTYLGYGAKQSGSATWVSTYDNFSGKRNYVAFDEDSVKMVFAPAQQTAVGSAITGLTEKFKFDLSSGVFSVVGTTSTTQAKLNIGSSVSGKYLYMDDGSNGLFQFKATTSECIIEAQRTGWAAWETLDLRASEFVFKPNNSEKMRIASGVSIGTSAATGSGGLLVDNDIKTNSRFGVGSSGSVGTPALYRTGDADTGVYFPSTNALGLVTGGTERLRIDSSGRVGINRTPSISNSKLEVGGADNVSLINVEASGNTGGMGIGSTGLQFFHGSSSKMTIGSDGFIQATSASQVRLTLGSTGTAGTNSSNWIRGTGSNLGFNAAGGSFHWEVSGAQKMGLSSGGDITTTGNVTAYSDERLKENIQTLDGKKVLEMRGVSFTKDGKDGSGVIAQELEKIAPELVLDGEYKSVAYGNLVGYLIENAKEQQKEINELKTLVKQLLEK